MARTKSGVTNVTDKKNLGTKRQSGAKRSGLAPIGKAAEKPLASRSAGALVTQGVAPDLGSGNLPTVKIWR